MFREGHTLKEERRRKEKPLSILQYYSQTERRINATCTHTHTQTDKHTYKRTYRHGEIKTNTQSVTNHFICPTPQGAIKVTRSGEVEQHEWIL